MATISKKHHFVPQFYLKNFAIANSEDKIHLYRRKGDIVIAGISDVAAENNLYTFKLRGTDQKTDIVEKMFGEVETLAAPIIRKVIEEQNLNLDQEESMGLSQFIALLATRGTPFESQQKIMESEMIKQMSIELAKHKDAFHKRFAKHAAEIDATVDIESLRQSVLNFDEHFKVELTGGRAERLENAVGIAEDLSKTLLDKSWHLLVANSDWVFVTSDNPVTIQASRSAPRMYNSGFLHGTILLPLTPKLCLLMRNESLSRKIIKVDRDKVSAINKSIMKSSNRFVYSNLKSRTFKNGYDAVPEDSSKVKVTNLEWAPYIIAHGPEGDPETIAA